MLTTPPSLIHKNAAILCLANLASQCPPHACTDSDNSSGSSPLMFIKPTAVRNVDQREKT